MIPLEHGCVTVFVNIATKEANDANVGLISGVMI